MSRIVSALGFVLITIGIFGRSLSTHFMKSMDPSYFHDDARIQIFPFFRYSNPEAFQSDYLGDYALSLLPTGFRAMYMAAAYTVDAEPFSKVLPYFLLVVTIVALAVAAHRLGGYAAAFVTVGICLGSVLYLDRITGGLPRSFGFPLAALALLALTYGRHRWLVAIVIAGAAFYPTVGLFSGMLLTAWFFILPESHRGDAMGLSFKKRVVTLGAVGLVSFLVLLPPTLGSARFGPRVTRADFPNYPEAAPGGLGSSEDRPPYPSALVAVAAIVDLSMVGRGEGWWPWLRGRMRGGESEVVVLLLLMMVLGLSHQSRTNPVPARFLLFFATAIGGYLLAAAVTPYMYAPGRFTLYTVPPLLALGSGVGLVGFVERFAPPRLDARYRSGIAAALGLLFFLLVGARGTDSAGLSVHLKPHEQVMYQKIRELPPTAMIGGWPNDPTSNIPYASRRRAFVTGEMHVTFHRAYLDEYRKRMRVLIDAYVASTLGPLVALRDDHGVTHLMVDPRHLRGRLGYAAPFGAWIREAQQKNDGRPSLALGELDHAVIHRDQDHILIDLSKIDEPH